MYGTPGYRPLYGLGATTMGDFLAAQSLTVDAGTLRRVATSASTTVTAATAATAPIEYGEVQSTPGGTQEGVLAGAMGTKAFVLLGGVLLGGVGAAVIMKTRKKGRR